MHDGTHAMNHDGFSAVDVGGGGGGGGIGDLGVVAMGLLELFDEVLMQMIRSLPLSEETLGFLRRLKSTNRRFFNLIRREMKINKDYRISVYGLSLFVPGTRIPCGAETVLALPMPVDMKEVMKIFESGKMAPNGLFVSNIFQYSSDFWTESWEHVQSVDEELLELRTFFLCVEIDFDPCDYFPNVDVSELPRGSIVDLEGLPNVVRSVMGLSGLTGMDDEIDYVNMCGYLRVVRVQGNTTMQQVFDAIRFVEGWNLSNYEMTMSDAGDLPGYMEILQVLQIADEEVIQMRPQISWPLEP